jgi:hypothetical protein
MEHLRLLPEITPIGCGQLPSLPLSPRRAVDILERPMRPQPSTGLTLSLIMLPEDTYSAHPHKAGHPGAGFFLRGRLGSDGQRLIASGRSSPSTSSC